MQGVEVNMASADLLVQQITRSFAKEKDKFGLESQRGLKDLEDILDSSLSNPRQQHQINHCYPDSALKLSIVPPVPA